jgi:hypothetical protein
MRAAALLMALMSVARADNTVPSGGAEAKLVASLERTPCYGACPVYKWSLFADGTLKYEGKRFVKKIGIETAKLSAAEVEQVRRAFREAKYFDFIDNYDRREMTDNPWTNTSFTDGDKSKSVKHYHGDSSAPAALTALEKKLDQIVKIDRFIGGDKVQR